MVLYETTTVDGVAARTLPDAVVAPAMREERAVGREALRTARAASELIDRARRTLVHRAEEAEKHKLFQLLRLLEWQA